MRVVEAERCVFETKVGQFPSGCCRGSAQVININGGMRCIFYDY